MHSSGDAVLAWEHGGSSTRVLARRYLFDSDTWTPDCEVTGQLDIVFSLHVGVDGMGEPLILWSARSPLPDPSAGWETGVWSNRG